MVLKNQYRQQTTYPKLVPGIPRTLINDLKSLVPPKPPTLYI